MNTFARTVDLMHRALDVNLMRREVLANNLSNAITPGFKRTDVNFESQLRRALESENRRPPVELTRTHPQHFPNWSPLDYRDVQPRRVLDFVSSSRNCGNNVDMEREIMLLTQNQMSYQLFVQAVSFEFSQMNRILRN